MKNEVYLDTNGIIVIDTHGDQDQDSIQAMGQKIEALITERRTLGKPVLVLDNLLNLGNVGPEGRKLVVQLARDLDYDRGAMVGKGGLMRFGANLMLRATGRSSRVKYFDDIHEARSWLLTGK